MITNTMMTNSMMSKTAESLINKLFPVKRHYFQRQGHQYHYVNEGSGEPVVMVHGNPSWSFYYRNLIQSLSKTHQCIVPDHIGCGLSDKPQDDEYCYTLKSRIDDLEALLAHLNISKNITLVVHDWGGMIGMGYAARHPKSIKKLVILNTAAFHLPKEKSLPWALWLCRNTMIGAGLVRGLNAFSAIASLIGVKRKPMANNVRQAYVAPFNSWHNRISTLRFVQDIPLHKGDQAYSEVTQIEQSLSQFSKTPALICWGLKDFVFDHSYLSRWQEYLPQAKLHRFDDCGHYILEDASDELVPLITQFIVGEQKKIDTKAADKEPADKEVKAPKAKKPTLKEKSTKKASVKSNVAKKTVSKKTVTAKKPQENA